MLICKKIIRKISDSSLNAETPDDGVNTSVMSRCRSLGVLIDICLLQTRKHTAGPPVPDGAPLRRPNLDVKSQATGFSIRNCIFQTKNSYKGDLFGYLFPPLSVESQKSEGLTQSSARPLLQTLQKTLKMIPNLGSPSIVQIFLWTV
ncbi:hypothetical protein ACTXT7_002312 [Hymenolepis weldensis]